MWRSDVLITIAYYFALFFVPFVAYIVLFEEAKNKGTRYKSPDWYYLIKRVLAIRKINRLKAKCRRSQTSSDEDLQEQPRKLTSGKQTDTQVIYGLDQDGNSLFLKVILRQHRIAEVILCLRLKNGRTYILPNEPQVLLCSVQSRQWKAEGLSITAPQPLRRIRITYNGLLRSTSQLEAKEKAGNVEHVKFNFIWNAADKPLHYPQDMPTSLFADGLARESWRDGHWIDLMGDERGFEQYGALQGFVSGEAFPEDLALHLPSFRKRYWGIGANYALHRDFSVFVVAEDGTLFNIGARSYKKGCAQLRYGTLLDNTANVHPIDYHDIRLEHIAENDIPNVISIHAKAKGRTYKCIVTINHQNTSTTSSGALNGWKLSVTPTQCIVNSQSGYAITYFWYPNNGKGVDLPDPLLTEPKIYFPQYEFVAPFLSKDCRATALTGGKGSSLALLSSLDTDNFTVPEGFAILASSFRHQIEQNEKLKQAVDDLEKVSREKMDKDLATACKETVELFSLEAVREDIANAIVTELDRLRKKSSHSDEVWRWAVRSSGLSEDSEELSSAGQNVTILGCTTEKEVLQAVARCWGSLFAFQSVQYRRQHGLDINSSMAVVVQRMVSSDTAGVLFTCHPTTGNPTKIVVTANYGLGESVVSSQIDPDTIVLNRQWPDALSVHSKTIGSKKTYIQMTCSKDKIGGTNVVEASSDASSALCLSEQQALLLGHAGIQIERAFGSPRDIEWAFHKNQLYILQSRPITTFSTWSNFELLHEFDTPILTNQELLTVANIAEVMPGAITPLSNTIINTTVANGVYKQIMKTREVPYVEKFTCTTHHHGVINVINSFLNKLENKITIAIKVLDMAVFGHPVVDTNIHDIAKARFGVLSRFGTFMVLARNAVDTFTISGNVRTVIQLASKFRLQLSKTQSASNMLDEIAYSLPDLCTVIEYHGKASHVSVFFQIMCMNILTLGSEDLTNDHYLDIALLLSSCSNVISAEIPNILEGISKSIREAGLLEPFLKVNPKDGLNWLKLNCMKASQELERFLDEHGHRGIREMEFNSTSWGDDPSVIVEMLQANCTGKRVSKSSEYMSAEDAVTKMVTPKNNTSRTILKFFLKRSRKAVAEREKTKSETVRMISKLRAAFRELARQMVAEGLIPDPQLIYFLSFYELQQIIKKRETNLVQKAIRRQRLYPEWDKIKIPELIFGVPKIEEDNTIAKLLRNGENKVRLEGTPVCPGDILARTCVITDLKDIDQLETGDILITHSTDVGWSPYFPMLSGVVTELGGLISHGAVIAREYGLPCIVGVRNATSVFKTGDKILLSGKSGILELMDSDINVN